MKLKQAFGRALKRIRTKKRLTQEDFSDVSSRTYLSTLERGFKSPTIDKVDDLAKVLGVHPLTILADCYLEMSNGKTINELLREIESELNSIYER